MKTTIIIDKSTPIWPKSEIGTTSWQAEEQLAATGRTPNHGY